MSASSGRRAGVLIPLFSCPSTASWGIGDISDVAPITAWLAGAGLRVLQLLPLNEMARGGTSPYSATSAMAIDPIFIRVTAVPEFAGIGGEVTLPPADRARLDEARRSSRVEYQAIRRLKDAAFAVSFERFREEEWRRDTARALSLRAYIASQAWWLDDYALFRAIQRREQGRPWTEWPEPLRRRDPDALERVRQEIWADVLYHQYCSGWPTRSGERRAPLPRQTASGCSAIFRSWWTATVPTYGPGRTSSISTCRSAHRPMRSARPVRTGACRRIDGPRPKPTTSAGCVIARGEPAILYDGYRVDHVVGFYRTYAWPHDGREPFFAPGEEEPQLALGERVLAVLREPSVEIIAEDLGSVPDFVRASLVRLGVPGFRVFRWERSWQGKGQPFRDPLEYPALSVAASGTHDTEPMATWWERASPDERSKVNELPTIQWLTGGAGLTIGPYDHIVRDVLLEALFASRSDLFLTVVQDVFGWHDRINEPATVNDRNWTFRLPWPSDRLNEVPAAVERQSTLRAWASRHGR